MSNRLTIELKSNTKIGFCDVASACGKDFGAQFFDATLRVLSRHCLNGDGLENSAHNRINLAFDALRPILTFHLNNTSVTYFSRVTLFSTICIRAPSLRLFHVEKFVSRHFNVDINTLSFSVFIDCVDTHVSC